MLKQVGPKICTVFLLALVRKKYNNETKLRNVFLGFLGSRRGIITRNLGQLLVNALA